MDNIWITYAVDMIFPENGSPGFPSIVREKHR